MIKSTGFNKMTIKVKCFDHLRNSLNLFFMEMSEVYFEFVCGYLGLKGQKAQLAPCKLSYI